METTTSLRRESCFDQVTVGYFGFLFLKIRAKWRERA